MTELNLELKGTNFTLSVIHLFDADLDKIAKGLTDKVAQAPSFFKFAPVVINVSNIPDFREWDKLKEIVTKSGLYLVGISGSRTPEIKNEINQAGIAVLTEGKKVEQIKAVEVEMEIPKDQPVTTPSNLLVTKKIDHEHDAITNEIRNKTRIVTTPIRSGQQVYARNADLVVINNVGAGAEVIADGNIHIYGIMRGKALAGASGDSQAQIFCHNLAAELISIAGNYWLNDQIPQENLGKSTLIKLTNDGLSIEKL